MTHEEAKAAIRARGHKVTPFRVGIEMGRSYKAEFDAWSAHARAARDYSGRPDAPQCPYAMNVSVIGWSEGFRVGMRRT